MDPAEQLAGWSADLVIPQIIEKHGYIDEREAAMVGLVVAGTLATVIANPIVTARLLGGQVVGLDKRMRDVHGSSWLFPWGKEFY